MKLKPAEEECVNHGLWTGPVAGLTFRFALVLASRNECVYTRKVGLAEMKIVAR